MIYFIQNTTTLNIKIGVFSNLKSRLSQLQIGNDCDLVVVGVTHGDIMDEKKLHWRFSKVRGEWFRPNDRLVSYIKNLNVDDEYKSILSPIVMPPDPPPQKKVDKKPPDPIQWWETNNPPKMSITDAVIKWTWDTMIRTCMVLNWIQDSIFGAAQRYENNVLMKRIVGVK